MKANKSGRIKEQFSAIREYFAFYICASGYAEKAPFLAIAPAPYLPTPPSSKYTLVMDLLECFCLRRKKSSLSFRPFADYFLDEMSQYF